jgi:hypothetical protein
MMPGLSIALQFMSIIVAPCLSGEQAAISVIGLPSSEKWMTRVRSLCANSTFLFEPPVRTRAMEKTPLPSLSRTFHSVRWT